MITQDKYTLYIINTDCTHFGIFLLWASTSSSLGRVIPSSNCIVRSSTFIPVSLRRSFTQFVKVFFCTLTHSLSSDVLVVLSRGSLDSTSAIFRKGDTSLTKSAEHLRFVWLIYAPQTFAECSYNITNRISINKNCCNNNNNNNNIYIIIISYLHNRKMHY